MELSIIRRSNNRDIKKTAFFARNLSFSGLVITKQFTVSEPEVLHSPHGKYYTGALKLNKSDGIG